MINGKRVGVSIITCNRPEFYKKCYDSIAGNPDIDVMVVVNDGVEYSHHYTTCHYIQNESNLGVAKSKNKALRFLMDSGCDHLFLMEDDIYVKDPTVFQKYIEASKTSGIQHFNYALHGNMNKRWPEGTPNPRLVIDYGTLKVSLYLHCVGAFSYYSKKCIESCGYMDEDYFNACEHVDHTYRIIKSDLHPPFWYFADIHDSEKYLGDEPWTLENSTISSRPDHRQLMASSDKSFISKHGMLPMQIPMVPEEVVCSWIKKQLR